MVGILGLVIFGPTVLSLTETVMPLFQVWTDEEDGTATFTMLLVPVLLLVLIHFLSKLFPSRRYGSYGGGSYSSNYDAEGFGLGSLILVVLFLVLYNYM